MQNTSAAYKMAIKAKTRTIVVKGRIQTPAGAIYDLQPSDIVSGTLSIKSSIFDAGAEIGNTIASDVSVSVHNDTGVWGDRIIAGSALWLWSGVVLPDDTTEYVLLGTFVVEKVSRPNRILSIIAADRLVLLDVPFSDVSIAFSTIGATLQEILDAVCSHCSVPPLSTSWTGKLNMTQAVLSRPADDLSCRDVVGMIAAISGSNVRMTRDGYLERLPLIPIVSADTNLDTSDRFSFEQTSGSVSLTGITYTDTDGTVYSAGLDGYTIALSSNPFLQYDAEQDLLDAIWTALDGFSYAGFTLDYPGDPAIDVGDAILNTTRDGETVLSIVGTSTFTVGSTSTLSAPVISDTESGYLSGNAKRLSTIAAKAEQVKNDLSSYESKSAQIADLMTAGMGLYKYELQQEDGSVVVVYGNKSTLETSDIQWKMTSGAFSVSHDYGGTWAAGLTASGEMLVTVLTAVGIIANWIKVGRLESADGNTYFDLDSGVLHAEDVIEALGFTGNTGQCGVVMKFKELNGYLQLTDLYTDGYDPTIFNATHSRASYDTLGTTHWTTDASNLHIQHALQFDVNGNISTINGKTFTFSTKPIFPANTVIYPALTNGWVNYGGGEALCSYFKDVLGFVHLSGTIRNGTVGASVFVLPAGFRPAANINVVTVSNDAFAKIQISSAGHVYALVGSPVWFSIAGDFLAAG